jgi:hypothetical protein
MATHYGGRWTVQNEQGVIRIERISEEEEVVLTARVTADEGRELAKLLIRRADEIDVRNEEILPTQD